MVVIGGLFHGMEFAVIALGAGKDVTAVEVALRAIRRAIWRPPSNFFAECGRSAL